MERKFKVNPVKIFREIVDHLNPLEETGRLEFIIDKGVITYNYRASENHGATHFRGSYHPNQVCEGEGICIWCGCTLLCESDCE